MRFRAILPESEAGSIAGSGAPWATLPVVSPGFCGVALNANGAGWSTIQAGARGALRVVPVPEPGTAGLVAVGMLLLGARGLRPAPGLRRRVRYPAAP